MSGVQIKEVKEVTLSANQEKSEVKKLEWNIEASEASPKILRGRPLRDDETIVEIAPMEIRTFLLRVRSNKHH